MQKFRNFNKLAFNGGKPLFKYQEKHFIGIEEKNIVNKILKSGELSGFSASASKEFFGGKYVKKLEKNFRQKFKSKHAVAFNSATTALYAAIMAIKPEPGDEIITTPYTMHATATSILQANCVPIFAERLNKRFEKFEKVTQNSPQLNVSSPCYFTSSGFEAGPV